MIRKQDIVQQAVQKDILNGETSAIGVMDFDALENTIIELKKAFTAHFVHTFATKANALTAVMKKLNQTGIGAEVSSPGELLIAKRAGFENHNITSRWFRMKKSFF